MNNIKRKVEANKIAAIYAKEYINNVNEVLKEFEGKKVIKADGYFTKAFNDRLRELYPAKETKVINGLKVKPHNFRLELVHRWLYIKSSVAVTFGKRSDGLDDFIYFDETYYVGQVEDNKLLYSKSAIKDALIECDKDAALNYEDIKAKRLEIIEHLKAIYELEKDLPDYAVKVSKYDKE